MECNSSRCYALRTRKNVVICNYHLGSPCTFAIKPHVADFKDKYMYVKPSPSKSLQTERIGRAKVNKITEKVRKKKIKKQSLTTSRPIPMQKLWKDSIPSCIAESDVRYLGMLLWPIQVSCPGFVPSQPLALCQPSCWGAVRNKGGVDTVKTLFKNSKNVGVLSTLL